MSSHTTRKEWSQDQMQFFLLLYLPPGAVTYFLEQQQKDEPLSRVSLVPGGGKDEGFHMASSLFPRVLSGGL